MTTYQTECFLAVAECLSFVKAAERMCITQPAISYQISCLEKELELRLFERSTRSCRLTPAGQAFYQDMTQMHAFYLQAVKRAQDIAAENKIKLAVGIRKLFDYSSLSEIVLKFSEKYPQSVVHILPHNDSNALDDVRSGRLDIGFCYSCEHTELQDFYFREIFTLDYYVLMNTKNHLAKKKSLKFADLKAQPVVTGSTAGTFVSVSAGSSLQGLRDAGADLSVSLPSYESAMIAIQSDRAVCVLPMLEKTVIPGMVKTKITDCPPVSMEIFWLRRDKRPSVQAFVNMASEFFEAQRNG